MSLLILLLVLILVLNLIGMIPTTGRNGSLVAVVILVFVLLYMTNNGGFRWGF